MENMGSISPVLDAFFKGQSQQSGILQQAQEISNQVAERKQRQQTIDEAIRQHDLENTRDQNRLSLEHDIFQLQHKKAQQEVQDSVIRQLQNGSAPIIGQGSTAVPTTMAIPGFQPSVAEQAPTIGGTPPAINGPQTPPVNLQMAGPGNGFSPNPNQTVQTAFGPITVPTPQTNIQDAVAQQQALLPGHVLQKQLDDKADLQKATDLFKATKEPQYLAQIDAANQRSEDNNQRSRDIADQRFQLGQALGEMRANANLSNKTGGLLGQQLQQHVDTAINGAAAGHYDTSKEAYPEIKQMVRNGMIAKGYNPDIPDKTFASIYSTANGAVDLKNTLDSMNTALQVPKNFTGRIADTLSGGAGYKGLGVDKSTYDMFAAKLAPTLEIASGMSPGSMRSTALLNMFKGLVRQPGNSAQDIARKDYMAVGIPLTAVSKQMSTLPQEQRKVVWGQVIKDNPRLMTMHPEIARSLANATQTGNFEPSKDLMDFISNASK